MTQYRLAQTSRADQRAFNAFMKGRHDDLQCTTLKTLANTLATRHDGATAEGVLRLLVLAHSSERVRVQDGIVVRKLRCQQTKRARRGISSQAALA